MDGTRGSFVVNASTWALSPDDPFFLKSAAIHDTLLETGFRQAFADSQWFEAALSEHAPLCKAVPAYLGMVVRRFVRMATGRKSQHQ